MIEVTTGVGKNDAPMFWLPIVWLAGWLVEPQILGSDLSSDIDLCSLDPAELECQISHSAILCSQNTAKTNVNE